MRFLAGSLQRASQPPDDDAAGAVVGRRLDLIADIKHLVMPVEMRDRFRGEPAATRDVQERGRQRRKLINVVQHRLEQLGRRNDPFGETLGQTCDGRAAISMSE